MQAREQNEDKINKLIRERQDELRVSLFLASLSLYGLVGIERAEKSSQLAQSIINILWYRNRFKLKPADLESTVRLSVESIDDHTFEKTFKSYIAKQASANATSHEQCLVSILQAIIGRRGHQEFDFNFIDKCRTLFAVKDVETAQALRHARGEEKKVLYSDRLIDFLVENPRFIGLLDWARAQDIAFIIKAREREAARTKISNFFDLRMASPVLLALIFVLMFIISNIRVRFMTNEEKQAILKNEGGIEAKLLGLATVGSVIFIYEWYKKHNIKVDLNTHKKNVIDFNESLENFLAIKIKIITNPTTGITQQKISLSSVDKVKDKVELFVTDAVLNVSNPQKQKQVKTFESSTKRTIRLAQSVRGEKIEEEQFVEGPDQLQRIVMHDKSRISVSVDKKVLETIPDDKLKERTFNAFKYGQFTGSNSFQVLANKKQIELRIPKSDFRLFGVLNESKEEFEMKEFRRSALH